MKEIVAAMIGTKITNNPRTISEAIKHGTVTEFLDRKRMRFMSVFDLGQKWQKLAEGPTFFCMDDEGNIYPPGEPNESD